jgi:hypothetical protein
MKQVGGTCYYMAALNFMKRATAVWRDIPGATSRLGAVLAFADKMTACSDNRSRAHLCLNLPLSMAKVHHQYRKYAIRFAQEIGAPTGPYVGAPNVISDHGFAGLLLRAIFDVAELDDSVRVVDFGDMIVRDQSKSVDIRTILAYAIETHPEYTLLGGVVTGNHHAISVNLCSRNQGSYDDAIVCNSWYSMCRLLDDPVWRQERWRVELMTAIYVKTSLLSPDVSDHEYLFYEID